MGLSDLPTLADMRQKPCATPKRGMVAVVDEAEAARKLDEKKLEAWKKAVRTRDKLKCRKCGVKVEVTLARKAKQAHAHHIVSRGHRPTRYDRRNGILLCRRDHERVEHNELLIEGTATFAIGNRHYIDGDQKVTFKVIG